MKYRIHASQVYYYVKEIDADSVQDAVDKVDNGKVKLDNPCDVDKYGETWAEPVEED